MPDLATIQTEFVQAILGDKRAAACATVAGDPAAAALRFGIYRNTALNGLAEALRLSYPVTERVVGAEFFEQTALAFARRSPPAEPVLARYGAGLPDFLQSLPALAPLPYVADLARLDWAADQAGLAPPGRRASGPGYTLATERGPATVTLAPSLRLLRVETSIREIWLKVRARDDDSLADLNWSHGPQWLAVHHRDDDIEVTALTPDCWQFCEALLAGHGLEAAIATVADNPDAAMVVGGELMSAPFIHVDFPRFP